MARPVIAEALEVLRAKCPGAPEGDFEEDLLGAWSGALRGVPDEHVLEAAEAWTGEWPRLTEFLSALGSVGSASSGPSPARQEQMRLTSAERKQRALDRIAGIRADLAARRQPEEASC